MRPLIVQQSFPAPRPTTNPYITLLARSLAATPGIEMRTFRWRDALLRRSDVFHAHWPEILVTGNGSLRTAARQALFVLLLLRLRASRTAVVRTAHNLDLPTGLTRRQTFLLRRFDRMTDFWIALNADTPFSVHQPHAVIPHGHYRDWFAGIEEPDQVPGRVSYFGLVRRYKNVDGLMDAFAGLAGSRTLEIAGKPSSAKLAEDLEARAARDPRVMLRLEFLDDDDLVGVVGRAELVVLPYRHMHNSGGVLTALSLDRPVLVPSTPTNQALSDEVGPGWVLQYAGELYAGALQRALAEAGGTARSFRPDLSAREWNDAGRQHLEAYRAAVRSRIL